MSESMPGTMSVFAEAYQNMLASQGKGGGLTGQAAVAALLDAVPTGQVRSGELLPFVSEEMQKRAAPKLDIARETSQGWQGRLANQRTGWAMIASEAGVEEGQRNFFRFFTQWMNENQDIPERFGKFWKDFSEQFAIAGGFPDLIRMTLEGTDTIIKEWLGEEKTAQFVKDFERLSAAASSAATFLGLMGGAEGEKSGWQQFTERGAALVGVGGALAEGDLGRAGSSLVTAFEGAGTAYVNRMPHLRAMRSIKESVYGFAIEPERDDEGFAIPYLRMTGQEPTYHPRGLELLTAGQGGGAGQSVNINIEGVTVTAPESSDPEAFADRFTNALEDALSRAMPGLNR